MRTKLIKLLRKLETESGFVNEYVDYDESYECYYSIKEYLDFPDYRFIVSRLNNEQVVMNDGIITVISSNSILAELKRMESDGLATIGTQAGRKYASTTGSGPDFDEGAGASFTTESVILTTQGKSEWRYFMHTTFQNPLASALSALAVIISIIALFK